MGALSAGSIVAGKYHLDHKLAQGGMGSVWAAFDTGLEVPVAVKFMAPALAGSPELVGRFEREAKAAAQLRSPHVVQVFEHGVDDGVPYIVMERLEGEDLGTRLKRQGRLSLWEAAAILEQVSKALRKAHDAGIVHRDLKPANIFVARHDEDEIVKVLDFGIAKSGPASGQGEGTRTGVVMGSPSYMSPEQVRSTKGVDHRSDLWSMGLVMFRVVTGKMAFTGENDADVIVKLCADPVPVPSQVAPDLSTEVDAWFARALSRDPEKRFQSAREMAAAFGRIVGRAPSLGDPAATSAGVSVVAAPEVIERHEATKSDAAETVRMAPQGLQALKKTLPLPMPAEVTALLPAERVAEVTAPLPEVVGVAASGATLTNAGSETATPVATAARGWVGWGIGGGVVVAVIATVAVMATRGAGVSAGPAGASAVAVGASAVVVAGAVVVASAVVVPSVTAEASAEPAPVVSATASASASVEPTAVASASASAGRAEPARVPVRGSLKVSRPVVAAPTEVGGLPSIPRVLPQK
jgi:serine/threonine-protein kinase